MGQRHKAKIAFVEQKCTRNISTNILTLGQRTHLKLRELSSLLRDNAHFYVDREQFLFCSKIRGEGGNENCNGEKSGACKRNM